MEQTFNAISLNTRRESEFACAVRIFLHEAFSSIHGNARYYSTIKCYQHALVVNKKSMINNNLAGVFSCVLKKVEATKEEGIRA